jgi:hypothetical protein
VHNGDPGERKGWEWLAEEACRHSCSLLTYLLLCIADVLFLLLRLLLLLHVLLRPATQRDTRCLAYGRLVHQLMRLWDYDTSPASQIKVGVLSCTSHACLMLKQ